MMSLSFLIKLSEYAYSYRVFRRLSAVGDGDGLATEAVHVAFGGVLLGVSYALSRAVIVIGAQDKARCVKQIGRASCRERV